VTPESASAWQRAASYAARRHESQRRKDGQTPYVAHPFRVAMTLLLVFEIDDPVATCAALLHDVLEDTPADYDELYEQFGSDVAAAVAALTKDMRLPEPEREAEYDRQIAEAGWRVKAVKLADVYDNMCDTESAPHLAAKAIDKARRVIDLVADEPLLEEAVQAVRDLIAGRSVSE